VNSNPLLSYTYTDKAIIMAFINSNQKER